MAIILALAVIFIGGKPDEYQSEAPNTGDFQPARYGYGSTLPLHEQTYITGGAGGTVELGNDTGTDPETGMSVRDENDGDGAGQRGPSMESKGVERATLSVPRAGGGNAVYYGWATHYGGGPAWGDSIDYNGGRLGCGYSAPESPYRDGRYWSDDPTIAAVGYAQSGEWPCGTKLEVCRVDGGGCIVVTRVDTCPGCGVGNSVIIDLSEIAHRTLCGYGSCQVAVRKIE